MIGVIFKLGPEFVKVTIESGNQIYFQNKETGTHKAKLEHMRLNKSGVIKEFPDLQDNPEWRKIALERFESKVKSFENESLAMEYVVKEFRKMGYSPEYLQRTGYRPRRYNGGTKKKDV